MTNTRSPVPGMYRHHNGGLYWVQALAQDVTNETNQGAMVIYCSTTTKEWFCRRVDEFFGEARPGVPRFCYVTEAPPLRDLGAQ